MIIVECPYCGETNNILLGDKIENLIRECYAYCECDYCKKVFEVYQGKEKYEVREVTII